MKVKNKKSSISDMLYYSKFDSSFQLVPIVPKKLGSKKVIASIRRQLVFHLIYMSFVWIVVYIITENVLLAFNVDWNVFCGFRIACFIVIFLYYFLSIVRFKVRELNLFDKFLSNNEKSLKESINNIIDYCKDDKLSDEEVYKRLCCLNNVYSSEANRKERIKRLKNILGDFKGQGYELNYETDSFYSKQYEPELGLYYLRVFNKNPYCLGTKSREYFLRYQEDIARDDSIPSSEKT